MTLERLGSASRLNSRRCHPGAGIGVPARAKILAKPSSQTPRRLATAPDQRPEHPLPALFRNATSRTNAEASLKSP